MRPTLDLLLDLGRQAQALMRTELLLVQAELRERGSSVSSSLTLAIVGLIFLPLGLGLLMVAASLLLTRLGLPTYLSFLIVAAVVTVAGVILLMSGLRGLKPSRLIPSKSISQISSLIGGL